MLTRRLPFEYVAAALVAVAAALALAASEIPPQRQDLAFAGLGIAYLVVGAIARRGLWRARSVELWLRLLTPYFLVGYVLLATAAAWADVEGGSHAVALAMVTGGVAGAMWIVRSRLPGYAAAVLLFAPLALALARLDVGGHERSLALLALAAVELVAAEPWLRRPWRHASLRRLLARPADGPLAAHPLFVGGLLALGVALAVSTYDIVDARGSDLAPWSYAGAAALLAVLSGWWRAPSALHAVAWLLVPALVLLGDRGFYAVDALTAPEQARSIVLLAAAYAAIALGLGRVAVRYAGPPAGAGYLLALGAILVSVPDRGLNALVVAIAIAIFGVSAAAADRGWHGAFERALRRHVGPLGAAATSVARGALQYPLAWLLPVELMLLLSLRDTEPAHYGVALTALAIAYAAVGWALGRRELGYRYPWYLAAYALSVVGPLAAWPDESLRLATFGASIALYAASGLVSRQVAWLQLAALLGPLWGLMLLDRLDVPRGRYGAAALGLATVYLLGAWAVHARGRLRRLRPIRERIAPTAVPLLTGAFLISAAGLGFSAWQERGTVVGTFAAGAAFYLLASIVLWRSALVYAAVLLGSVAYVAGVPLIEDLDPAHEGLALLPGAAGALAAAALSRRWAPRSPAGLRVVLGRSLPSYDAAATPLYLAAIALALLAAAWSTEGGWPLAATLAAAAALIGGAGLSLRGPIWLVPALLAGELAYLQALFLGDAWSTWPLAMTWLVPVVVVAAASGEWLWRREHRKRPTRRPLLLRWSWPLHAHAGVALVVSLAVASVEPWPGLATAAAYAVVAGAVAAHRRSEALAWVSLALLGAAVAHALRIAELSIEEAAIAAAAAALGLRIAAEGARTAPALALWSRPLRLASMALALAAVAVAVGAWVDAEWARAEARPLTWVLAVMGLHAVLVAYAIRELRLSYLGVGLLEAAFALQLVHVEVDEPQLFALPAGLYLLAIARLERRRGAGAATLALEWGGVALLLAVPLAQAIGALEAERSVETYRRLLFAEGLAVLAGAAVLRWKRPFFAALVAFVADIILLLIEPVQHVNQWIVFGAIGVLMIALGLAAERSRTRVIAAAAGMRTRLEQWS